MAKLSGGLLGDVRHGIITGVVGAGVTTAVIAAFGQAKTGDPWTPFNAISHMLFGQSAAKQDGFVPRETLVGLGLNGAALVTWGVLYEAIAGKVAFPASLLTGGIATGIIYLLDYHILPERLRPNFEKRVGYDAVWMAYIFLFLALAFSPLWRGAKK